MPVLTDRVKDSEKPVRIAAILSLGRVGEGNSQVIELIHKFREDPDPEIRSNSVVALASLGRVDGETIPVLLEALSSNDDATSKAAGRALGNLGVKEPEKVVPHLLGILEKEQWPASRKALRVLKRMKSKAAPALPQIAQMYDKADSSARLDLMEAVAAIDATGDYALPILVKAVQDPETKDRREALLGLMRFRTKPEAIVGPVTEVLKDTDPEDRLLAIGIIRGLGQAGLPALPKLLACSNDSDLRVRSAALNALTSYRPVPPEVFDCLENNLKDRDQRARSAAVNALRNLGPDYQEKTSSLLKAALEVEKNGPTKKVIESALQSLAKPHDNKTVEGAQSEKDRMDKSSKK